MDTAMVNQTFDLPVLARRDGQFCVFLAATGQGGHTGHTSDTDRSSTSVTSVTSDYQQDGF